MSNVCKSFAFAVFLGLSLGASQASTMHEHNAEQINPNRSAPKRHLPKTEQSSSIEMSKPASASAVELPDLKKINQSGISVRSTVQNPISSAPTFHYQDEHGNEITERRELGQPSSIDVRSSMGTHYQLSEPMDPTQAPNGSLRSVPSVKLSY